MSRGEGKGAFIGWWISSMHETSNPNQNHRVHPVGPRFRSGFRFLPGSGFGLDLVSCLGLVVDLVPGLVMCSFWVYLWVQGLGLVLGRILCLVLGFVRVRFYV